MLARLTKRYAPSALHQTRPLRKLTAFCRYLSYRSFRLRKIEWTSAPVGILLLGLLGGAYFLIMALGPQPYYWPNTATVNFGGSPPVATRTGWLSLACMPFVFATAGKSNLISALTGVSYEKLQVFHRWISYAFFVLALVHTFPFIVLHLQKGDMMQQWNEEAWYWTGTVALVAQAWLTFASVGPLRVRLRGRLLDGVGVQCQANSSQETMLRVLQAFSFFGCARLRCLSFHTR